MARKKKKAGSETADPATLASTTTRPFEGSGLARIVALVGIGLCGYFHLQVISPEPWAWVIPSGPRQRMTVTTGYAVYGWDLVAPVAPVVLAALALALIPQLYRNPTIRSWALGGSVAILGAQTLWITNVFNLFGLGVLLIVWALYINRQEAKEATRKAV
jgi:hypothetical protein